MPSSSPNGEGSQVPYSAPNGEGPHMPSSSPNGEGSQVPYSAPNGEGPHMPSSAPNGEGPQVPSASNTPSSQEGAIQDKTTSALTAKQLEKKAYMEKKITKEEKTYQRQHIRGGY